MAIATSTPLYLPISALLPPSEQAYGAPPDALPSPSTAILGPLPPTTPLHLALTWLASADLPEYESVRSALAGSDISGESSRNGVGAGAGEGAGDVSAKRRKRTRPRPERVLIITGRKDEFYQAIQDDDEDWMRDHGSDYGVLDRLKRVDVRYCPSPDHLTLLLSLLTSRESTSTTTPASESAFNLDTSPGLIILWDLAATLMQWEGADENQLPDDGMGGILEGYVESIEPRLRFKKGVKLSDYLDLIAAARASVDHLSGTDTSRRKTQLVILEPNLDAGSSLPVIPPQSASTSDLPIPSQSRQKRIKVVDGLQWMLGPDAIGLVSPFESIAEDIHAPNYQLEFPSDPDKKSYMSRKRCGRGEWARPTFRAGDTEGDQGGWRWEWS